MMTDGLDLTARLTIGDSLTQELPLVSRDNKYLLCCCGCHIKVYSVQTGQLVHILKGHSDIVACLAFNPANQFQVISCSLDGTLRKWNFEDGVLVSVSTPLCADDDSVAVVHRIITLPDDKTNFLYFLRARDESSEQKSSFKLVKQCVMMERWSSADLVIRNLNDLPSHTCIGGQGSFLASLTSPTEFSVTSLSRAGKVYKHRVTRDVSQVEVQQCLSKLTCLTAHPTEDCVAVGHADGKINIWSNVVSKKSVYTWVHWHALPVLSLRYTPEGSFLLSGGHESVLVKWPHGSYGNRGQREFLPRLGAPVSHITSSEDNSVYVTSHLDNSVKVIKNWIVVQVFQGLTRDYLSSKKNVYPAGVNFEPRSGALVVNGLPGHLQFYSLKQDSLLYNLDIVAQNYVSGDSLSKQSNYTRIEMVKFSPDGHWMVTVERWTGPYSQQCRMKFWYLDIESNSYVLNTDVDTPHQGAVSCVQFSNDITGPPTLVSVGKEDNKFKLWSLNVTSADKVRSAGCWRVESTGYYKDRCCSVADFSDDGSVLAVAFEKTLTLWDPLENHLCTTLDQGSKITALKFCGGKEAGYVVVATKSHVIIWDLLNYSEKQRWNIPGVKVLAVDPRDSAIAAFSYKDGFVFNCSGEMHKFALPGYAHNVTSAAFTTDHQCSSSADLSSVKQRLYLSTKSGSILVVDDADVSLHSDVTPTVEQASRTHIASNYQRVTPLTNLLTSQLVRKDQTAKQIDSRTGLAAAQIIKQIGETSCVAMPSMNTLCRAFLSSLLLDKSVNQSSGDRELSDTEMDVDDDSGDTEGSDSDNDIRTNKKQPSDGEQKVEEQKTTRSLRKLDIINFSALQNT